MVNFAWESCQTSCLDWLPRLSEMCLSGIAPWAAGRLQAPDQSPIKKIERPAANLPDLIQRVGRLTDMAKLHLRLALLSSSLKLDALLVQDSIAEQNILNSLKLHS